MLRNKLRIFVAVYKEDINYKDEKNKFSFQHIFSDID